MLCQDNETLVVDLRKGLRAAEIEARVIFGYVDNGREIVVGRSEHWCAPVEVDDRPILRVHVAVTNSEVEYQAANEFETAFDTRDIRDLSCNVVEAHSLIFIGGIEIVGLRIFFSMEAAT